MSATRRILWMLALAALLLQVSLTVAAPYVHPQTQIAFPDTIAGLPRGEVQDYEPRQPGAGVRVRYQRHAALWADVYAYTAGQKNVPADATHPIVEQLRQSTERDIVTATKTLGYELRKGESRTLSVDTPKGPVPVLFESFLVAKDGFENSFFWLWVARGHFLKIRMTRKAGEHDPKAVREFYEAVVRLTAE